MVGHVLTLALYLGLGLFMIASPLLARALPRKHAYVAVAVLGVAALWVGKIDAGHNHKLLLGWILVAAIGALAARKQWRWIALGSFAGMALASPMPWWRHEGKFTAVSWSELFYYCLVSTSGLVLLVRNFLTHPDARPPKIWRWGAVAMFVPFALFLSFSTGISEARDIQIAWWHHWGAYVGPAELMRGGAHIFRDFPAQYGLGPTALIAAACRNDCWTGMYYIVGLSTCLMALLVLAISLSLGIRSRAALIVLPVATIVACFFWTSYGPSFASPILYPSVSGLRFLPAVMLVAALCRFEKNWQWFGHALWAVGALWSPESLYAVSFVWWPYYCWRQIVGLEWRQMPLAFIRAVAMLIAVLLAVLAIFLAVYFLAYHDLPSLRAWAVYMLYPPGPLPINPKGPVWWYAATLVLGMAALFRAWRAGGDTVLLRRNFLVLLMGYAVLSYCMGRGHDNNFLNLTPFAFLILVGAFGSLLPVTLRAMGAAMIASLIGWVAIFGWGIWRADWQAGRLFEFAPGQVMASFAYTDPVTAARMKSVFAGSPIEAGDPADAARAIAAHKGEAITMLDPYYLMPESTLWDAFHPVEIYPYMPQDLQIRFLRLTAQRFKKDGWVIADKKFNAAPWLAEYNQVYDLAGEEDYGSYHAYHFVPKSGG